MSKPLVDLTTVLTLKGDTSPTVVKLNRPRGTLYWGGAGLDGGYIPDQLRALQEAGIKYVYEGKRSYGMPIDALRSGLSIRFRGGPQDDDWKIHGMEDNPSPQFNMIGYSYGSLLAAQTAYYYAYNGHIVNHLALVGSPIDQAFLDELRRQKNIKKIIIKNLREYKDPLYAGMPELELLGSLGTLGSQRKETDATGEGVGHFYYAMATPEGNRRRRELAKFLFNEGLR